MSNESSIAIYEVTIQTPPDCGGDPSEEEVQEAVYDAACDMSARVTVRKIPNAVGRSR